MDTTFTGYLLSSPAICKRWRINDTDVNKWKGKSRLRLPITVSGHIFGSTCTDIFNADPQKSWSLHIWNWFHSQFWFFLFTLLLYSVTCRFIMMLCFVTLTGVRNDDSLQLLKVRRLFHCKQKTTGEHSALTCLKLKKNKNNYTMLLCILTQCYCIYY